MNPDTGNDARCPIPRRPWAAPMPPTWDGDILLLALPLVGLVTAWLAVVMVLLQ